MTLAQRLEAQLKQLEKKLSQMPPTNKGYYALQNKVKNMKKKVSSARYQDFLAQ